MKLDIERVALHYKGSELTNPRDREFLKAVATVMMMDDQVIGIIEPDATRAVHNCTFRGLLQELANPLELHIEQP